jgi:hypothetical protein
MNAPAPVASFEVLVDRYVKLRDRLKEVDDAHKEKTKPAREMLEQMNGQLLDMLNKAGGDSMKTKAGTVYRTSKKSATIADGAEFRRFVIGGEHWDLVDWRANATAIQVFADENNSMPPGVNFTQHYVVGVRRA